MGTAAAVRALILAATLAAAGSASIHDDFLQRSITGKNLHVVTGTATSTGKGEKKKDDEKEREGAKKRE